MVLRGKPCCYTRTKMMKRGDARLSIAPQGETANVRRADLIGGVLLLAFSLMMLWVIIPAEVSDGKWYGLSPYAYPNIICGAMALFSVLLIGQSVFKQERYRGAQGVDLTLYQLGIFLLLIITVVAGVWLISFAGFFIGSPVLIVSVALIMGERRRLVLCASAILPTLAIYALATFFLKTPLP